MQAEEQSRASLKKIGDFKVALVGHDIFTVTISQGKIIYVNDHYGKRH